MKTEMLLKAINERLSSWTTEIYLNDKDGLCDINKISEGPACRLLNEVYDYQLINLNKDAPNYPFIDLGDEFNGVAFQVTSRTDTEKIIKTLKGADDNNYWQEYPNGIKFFVLSKEKIGKGKRPWKNFPNFDFDRDVINIVDFMKKITTIGMENPDKLERIYEIITQYIGPGSIVLSKSNDVEISNDLKNCFNRPAFLTPFAKEASVQDFDKAVHYTIKALSTGLWCTNDGIQIKRITPYTKISNSKLRQSWNDIYMILIDIRNVLRKLVKSKEIVPSDIWYEQPYISPKAEERINILVHHMVDIVESL